jgi:hypothetical protein
MVKMAAEGTQRPPAHLLTERAAQSSAHFSNRRINSEVATPCNQQLGASKAGTAQASFAGRKLWQAVDAAGPDNDERRANTRSECTSSPRDCNSRPGVAAPADGRAVTGRESSATAVRRSHDGREDLYNWITKATTSERSKRAQFEHNLRTKRRAGRCGFHR